MKNFFVAIFMALLLSITWVQAAEQAVTITSDISEMIYQTTIEGTVSVNFENPALYNEGVKLSWHIYDAAGQELLFENQRIPFSLDADGSAQVPVTIDLASSGVLDGRDSVEVRFDLIDEANLFWFASNPNVEFSDTSVRYQYSAWGSFQQTMIRVVQEQPLLLVCNLLVDIAIVVLILRAYRKKQRFCS